jgi:hypothetical protein
MDMNWVGAIVQDRAWFYHSHSTQDVRLVRRAGQLVDRTVRRARRPSSQESIVSGAAADGSRDRPFTCFAWMTNDGDHSLT